MLLGHTQREKSSASVYKTKEGHHGPFLVAISAISHVLLLSAMLVRNVHFYLVFLFFVSGSFLNHPSFPTCEVASTL